MKFIADAIRSSLDELPAEFSTHELIIALAKNHQHDYIRELYEAIDSERPFQNLHAKIGKYLKTLEGLVVLVKEDYRDKDIFGQSSENGLWRKLA